MKKISLITVIRTISLLLILWAVPAAAQTLTYSAVSFSSGTFDNTHVEQGVLTFLGRWDFFDAVFSPRNDFGLGQDSDQKTLVLFGGRDHNDTVYGDTWEWESGTGWTQVSPSTGPCARYGHKMVWMGDKFLLFGGKTQAGDALDDTWLYDQTLNDWSRVIAVSTPEARGFFGMGFDPDERKVVVFGGEQTQLQALANTTWEFDADALTWTSHSLTPAPSPRIGPAMTYDAEQGGFVLFGGRDTTWNEEDLFSDTWFYDAASRVWTDKNPSMPPPALVHAAMVYDPVQGQTVLSGGLKSATLAWGIVYFYDAVKNRWAVFNVETNPLGRYGHEMYFDEQTGRGAMVGGRRTTSTRSTWLYTLKSTGSWTSPALFTESDMNIGWTSVTVDFSSTTLPAGTTLYLQVAYSTTGASFGNFSGPDGLTTTYYTIRDQTPVALWSDAVDYHAVKVRALFESADMPNRFSIEQILLDYNRSAHAPDLQDPANGARINTTEPTFSWTPTNDPDGAGDAPFTYDLMAATSSDFAAPAFSTHAVISTSTLISYVSTVTLAQTTWYWRVRATDARDLVGVWSAPFSLFIDTVTPASAVTVMNALAGPGHDQITLGWTFPGDDNGSIDGGQYVVRYSTAGAILSEPTWSAAASSTFSLTAAASQQITTVISGLAEATTYYFAVKTIDENGNVSTLSTVSPAVRTNNTPVAVSSMSLSRGPLNSDVTVTWIFPGDEPTGPDEGIATVRYSKTRLMADETDWALADGQKSFSYNASSGAVQISVVTGLETETTYYFAMKLVDELSRSSALSTVHPSIVTNRPPVAISQLTAARGAANGAIDVTWTYAGDDDLPTVGGIYAIKYRTDGPILLDADWTAAPFQSSGVFTGTTGNVFQNTIGGLADGTTYYFAIRLQDPLGSLSGISTVSPSTATNRAPAIALTNPMSGTLSNPVNISWDAADVDGDALTYAIKLSMNGGASYPIAIATVTSPATFYVWSVSGLPNGSQYRLRVEATDPMGLQAMASSANLTRSGNNTPPSVNFISAPAFQQSIAGTYVFEWQLVSPSSFNSYSFDLSLSSNGGTTYQLLVTTTGTSYAFNSTAWTNGANYRARIVSADASVPPLTAQDISSVFEIDNNHGPENFSLLKPLADDFPSIFHVTFAWEASDDEDGDPVRYQLRYWNVLDATNPVVASNLAQTSYTPNINTLAADTVYGWAVTASDGVSSVVSGTATFTLSRSKVKSPDRMITVEILSPIPGDAYPDFQDAEVTQAGLLEMASAKALQDRLITLINYPTWDVRLADLSGNTIAGVEPTVRLTMQLPDVENVSSVRGFNPGDLKAARLNADGSWRLVENQAGSLSRAAANVAVTSSGLAVYSMVGAPSPDGLLSSLANFPNPFAAGRENTRIQYVLTADADVTIRIYNIVGDLVNTLTFASGATGGQGSPSGWLNEVSWNGLNGGGDAVANGMYIAVIEAKSGAETVRKNRRIGVLK